MALVRVEQGDITKYKVDAIVNAANCQLQLGGGLAGAIARAGGPEIQAQCDRHKAIRIGEAAITGAGRMPAKFVIHQASMSLGEETTAEALRASTRAVLALAEANGVRTLAFPATGTGIAGFPLRECAMIMLGEVKKHLAGNSGLTEVVFVLFDQHAARIFEDVHEMLWGDR